LQQFSEGCLAKSARGKAAILPVSRRRIDVEDRAGYSLGQTEGEANRCFNCGCVAVNASDMAPALIALGAKIRTTKRVLEAGDFFSAGIMKTSRLEEGELVAEIEVPKPAPGSHQQFIKFALRNSHDFPVVSAAAVVSCTGGRVDSARLALGAVAPVPLRMEGVEAFLKGKKLDKKAAAAAAKLAVKQALPLLKNRYKVQVTGALVEKVLAQR
jgi:CO/xanthine dehydrogenase FAD-binding subunit